MDNKEVSIAEFLLEAESISSPQSYDIIYKAFMVANKYHHEQKRLSGQPYIIHPVNVAYIILKELNGRDKILAAALLHDVIEDTNYSRKDMIRDFGEEITTLVQGVTKVSQIKNKSKELVIIENVKKMLMATIYDPRVIIIKLADKIHNMRSLGFQPPEKQIRIANEVMNIYAPIAARLGIYKIKSELEDLAFKAIYPEEYTKIKEFLDSKKLEWDLNLELVIEELNKLFNEAKLDAIIESRPKNLYSIHKKLINKDRKLDEIYDLRAIRVITRETRDCYAVLGIVHNSFTPIPNRVKDYIASPKTNLYQSLHTTVLSMDGKPIEFQIRTEEMNQYAESGIAAHWAYKEGKFNSLDQKFIDRWKEQIRFFTENPTANYQDFFSDFSKELYEDEIIAFTPKGDMFEFPKGATVLDFAFRIHTDVGLHTRAARVNGKFVAIRTELNPGDQVEIITDSNVKPSPIWERILKTPHARQKLRQYFRKLQDEQKKQVETEIIKMGSSPNIAIVGKELEKSPRPKKKLTKEGKTTNILVGGHKDILVKLANCCSPIPGDDIVGFITKGTGVSVHKKTCDIAQKFTDSKKIVKVRWHGIFKPVPIKIEVIAIDRPKIYVEIVNSISRTDTNIIEAGANTIHSGNMLARFLVEIEHLDQLEEIIENLKSIQNVISVERKV